MSHLVALHAVGLDADQWQFCTGLGGAQKITFPGHGSEPMTGPVSLPDLADAVALAIPPGSTVVGLSLGGMVAQHLALRHPALVESLVLVCTKPAVNAGVMRDRARNTERLGMDALVGPILARWFTAQTLEVAGHAGVSYARKRIQRDDPASIASYWRAMAEHDLRDVLHRITQPVTVVVGSEDLTTSIPAAGEFARIFPHGRLDVKSGSHLLCLDRPDQTDEAVGSHLNWTRGR